jgi:hypothetical protein
MEKEESILTSSEELRMRRETQVLDEKPIPPFKVDILWAMGDSLPEPVSCKPFKEPRNRSQPGGIDFGINSWARLQYGLRTRLFLLLVNSPWRVIRFGLGVRGGFESCNYDLTNVRKGSQRGRKRMASELEVD